MTVILDNEPWREWHGGDCPVPKGTRGQVIRRIHMERGALANIRARASRAWLIISMMRWEHYDDGELPDDGDIVFYRLEEDVE